MLTNCASRERCRSCAAACRSRFRFLPRSTPAPPDRARVAIDADDPSRERIIRTLADRADIVPRDAAHVVLRDAAGPRDALAAIADGFGATTILLVDDPHADVALAALRAGAAAVLARQADARELLAAIEAVRAGLIVIDAAAREALAQVVGPPAATTTVDPLTSREREVLSMLASGLSNRRIGDRLAVSENTIKAHVASILAKLGATTRTEAVAIGVRLGLVML